MASNSSTASAAAASDRARHHRPVVGEQHRVMAAGVAPHRLGKRHVARRVVGHQRQRADAHHVVGRQRRQQVGGIESVQHGHRHRMRRVQVDDRLVALALLVHREMQEALLGRCVARDQRAVPVELRQPRRVQAAEVGAGRGQQPAVRAAGGNVAGRAVREAALEDRPAERANVIAKRALLHHPTPVAPAPWRRSPRCRNCRT